MTSQVANVMNMEDFKLWKTAVDSSANAVVITDYFGKIVWVNQTFTKITGYLFSDVEGKTPAVLKHDDGTHFKRSQWNQLWTTILSGRVWKSEITNRKKNGDLYTCFQTITPVYVGSKIKFFVAVHDDITDKKKYELDLQIKNTQLELAQNIARVGYWEWDAVANIFHWSDQTYQLFGVEKTKFDLNMSNLLACIHPEDVDEFRKGLNASIHSKSNFSKDIRIIKRCEDETIVRHLHFDSLCGIDANGFVINLSGIVQDITDRKSIENELADQLSFMQTMIESNPNPIYYKDLNGLFIGMNKAFERLFKTSRDVLVGKCQHVCNDSTCTNEGIEYLEHRVKNEDRMHHMEIHHDAYDKDLIFNVSPFHDSNGTVCGVIGTIIDISDRKKAEDRIRHMAYHDALTGLVNRAYLYQQLDGLIGSSNRSSDTQEFAVFLMDLDHFKDVNDTLGHDMGDVLLKQAAQRIESCLRTNDVVARLGGDEFAVIVKTAAPEVVAEKILMQMKKPYDLEGNVAYADSSIGIAMFPKDGMTANEIIKSADLALYKAKEDGRGKYHFFTEEMNETVRTRKQIEDDLRTALMTEEFELYYQPRVAVARGRYMVAGAECLLRWNHPRNGVVSPAAFIDIAEKDGLIIPISEWVIDKAVETLKRWHDQGHRIGLSINISPNHFKTAGFMPFIEETIKKHGVNATFIELEITENILLKKSDRILDNIERLSQIGIELSIDDFGTGYSSLNYLRKLKVKSLKIDKSFVDEIGQNHDGEIIVNTIIGLGRNLGINVVAEGVETQQQLEYLERQHCDEIQGYYFSKPIPEAEFLQFVDSFYKYE